MKLFIPILLAVSAYPSTAAPDAAAIIARAVELGSQDGPLVREYELMQETIERQLSKEGEVTETKRRTYQVVPLGGQPYLKLIRREGQPISQEDLRKEQIKYEEATRKRANETPAQRQRRLEEYEEKTGGSRREMFAEIPKAFNFHMVGEEVVDGHDVWVVGITPKPGYKPSSFRTSFLTHLKGTMHAAKQDGRLVKLDVVTDAPMSVGWFLAKLSPGTRISIEQMRLPEGMWVMKRFKMTYDVRLALIKRMRGEKEQVNWNYKAPPTVAHR